MEDKVVELTRFTQVSEAEMLSNLLKSEGIDCYVRDSFISEIYKGADFGGAKVELLEKDLQRATEIMEAFGYVSSDQNTGMETPEAPEVSSEDSEIPEESNDLQNPEVLADPEVFDDNLTEYEQNKAKLSRNLAIIGVLILIVLGIIIFLNRYYNG